MSALDAWMGEFERALRSRGAPRRRALRECRDHLEEAAGERGEDAAVRAFGSPAVLAASLDAELAFRRGLRSCGWTTAAVLATAGSTLTLIAAAAPGARAPLPWAVAFFVAAQVSGVATALAVLQALGLRRAPARPADVGLLARRAACALVAALVTLFAAGAALPGRGSAVLLLVGPVLVAAAGLSVGRASRLARGLPGGRDPVCRPPLHELLALVGRPSVPDGSMLVLLVTTVGAASAAGARTLLEHDGVVGALATGAAEAAAVLACYALLGRQLGLRPSPRAAASPAPGPVAGA